MRYIDSEILEKANRWLTPFFDAETQLRIKELIAYDSEELNDSFYKNLEFGTGGMRGIMGDGDNRINQYTLGKNTQGISNYLKRQFPDQPIKVAIAYDCRNNSKTLAKTVAEVFSANEIDAYLYPDLRPTPLLSFAVRHLGCQCGIVLTASHNPPEYNGYKVYWQDGGQLVPPQDKAIVEEINRLQYEDIRFQPQENRIHLLDDASEIAFAKASLQNGSLSTSEKARQNLRIVFTPLHGTSITMIPKVLKEAGYTDVHIVEEQAVPDGNFATVKSPNPEEPEALQMALDLAQKTNADIVIGTDPDCDRLGIAVRNPKGEMQLLNGNQTMVVMTDFLLRFHQKNQSLPQGSFVASTIVSTPMMNKIAANYGVELKESLTGFKWIAKMINDFPEQKFIGGGEESYGYLVGDFVRDKDAVTATLLACEIAAQCKEQGKTVVEYLEDLYVKHGYYKEILISLTKKGQTGAEEIKQMMHRFRDNPLLKIARQNTVLIEDYLNGVATHFLDNSTYSLDLPSSDVLIYYLEDGTKICARPSGTEPKIKFYFSLRANVTHSDEIPDIEKEILQKATAIKHELGIEG